MIRAVWELSCSNCGKEEYRPIEPLPAYKIAGPNIVFTTTGLDPRAYLRKVGWQCDEEPTLLGGEIAWHMLCPYCAELATDCGLPVDDGRQAPVDNHRPASECERLGCSIEAHHDWCSRWKQQQAQT